MAIDVRLKMLPNEEMVKGVFKAVAATVLGVTVQCVVR
jgi:hypothetical protein